MVRTIALCLAAAVFEGLDIQSMGVAAPAVAHALHLSPQQMGSALSASIMGLMIGAWIGGAASDRYGRRVVLTASMLLLGIFSLLTTQADGFVSMVGARLLAGLGLGGTLPTLIALATDVAFPRRRIAVLGIIYAGLPLGGVLAGAVTAGSHSDTWHPVFLVGGVGPLVLAPLLWLGLDRGRALRAEGQTRSDDARLFGTRKAATLLLWTSYFFTLLAVYLLLNWMPSTSLVRGHTPGAAAIWLNLGAVIGGLVLGLASDRWAIRSMLVLVYAGMIASLAALVAAPSDLMLIACFVAGFFVIGGQLILYALAPMVYPAFLRGKGTGAAVSVGRAGSMAGPLLGGLALGAGMPGAWLPVIAAPGLLLAVTAAQVLASRDAKSPR